MTPRLIARLTAPVACLAALLLVMAVGSAWYLQNIQRSVSGSMASYIASMRAAQELEISIREVSTQFNRFLITLDDAHLKPIPRLKERTANALADAERAATTPAEQILMKRTRQGYDHFFEEYDRIFREREQWKYSKIIELIDNVLQKEILEPAHEYLRINEGMLAQASNANQELADRLTTGLLALGFCGSFSGLLGGTVIAVTVRRSMVRTEERVRTTAKQLGQAVSVGPHALHPKHEIDDPLEEMTNSASAVLNRLRQTERDALRAEQLAWVGQMAAGIAHEIRNPLMAIKLLVQATAERRSVSLFKNRDLQVLEEEIIRLEQIVSGFLDFARPPRLILQVVDLRDLVQRTLDGVKARAELQKIEIRLEAGIGPMNVSADPNQLRQVLFNLYFNALDAQPQGGELVIHLEKQTSSVHRSEVILSVTDRGPGVSPELMDQIFDPFVSTKETGLGLGLSICRRIVETHGGSLRVVSSNQGAKFILSLPGIEPDNQQAQLETNHGEVCAQITDH